MLRLCDDFEAKGQFEQAAEALKAIYEHDPLDDDVFKRYLKLLAYAGQKSKMVRAYERHKLYLADELGFLPDETVQTLLEELLTHEGSAPQRRATSLFHHQPRKTQALPVASTAFVGREKELRQLSQNLKNKACRLLSIISGGMGKTRLALEAARQLAPSFEDGVAFVALEMVTESEGVVPAIADALQLEFPPGGDPKDYLLDFLAHKEILLLLDNCEHLVHDLDLIAEMLVAAERLKILTTSREHLNIQAEWLFDLTGMKLGTNDDDFILSDAALLFVQSAQKAQPSFKLSQDLEAMINICQHVEGMPLALELAASWLRVLSLGEFLEDLKSSLDSLESTTRDIPNKHQSIRNIYEVSWSKLNEREQQALNHLAVFQGGFSKDAAKEVADVGVPLLLSLVNKSFVRKESTGRFSQHPLIWQFVRERLIWSEQDDLLKSHAAYFAQFAADCDPPLVKKNQKEIFRRINLELANLKTAWYWSVSKEREDLLDLISSSTRNSIK